MKRIGIALAHVLAPLIAVAALPQPSFAQQDREADLRCLAAFATRVSAATDDAGKQKATIGLIYYFGRIDGEAPNTDLQAELERLGRTMSEADLSSAIVPCAKLLGERGKVLMTVGDHLQRNGQ